MTNLCAGFWQVPVILVDPVRVTTFFFIRVARLLSNNKLPSYIVLNLNRQFFYTITISKCLCSLFLYSLEYWLSSAELKNIWKVKGIVDELDTYEHNYIELSDDDEQKPTAQTDTNENEDGSNENESCDSDSSEVCGAIASNKFSVLDMSN